MPEGLHYRSPPSKVIQESLGFRIPRCGFRIPRCGFRIPCLWIPDSTSTDSGFHNQQPGFWTTIMVGLRIPLAGFRIPKPWISDSTRIPQTKINWIPDYLTWGDIGQWAPFLKAIGVESSLARGRKKKKPSSTVLPIRVPSNESQD